MTDTPEPPAEPYEIGDRVRVRLTEADTESPFEGTICRVGHVFADEPEAEAEAEPERNGEPERQMDRASYRLEDTESGETLPIVLRHRDLIPVGDET